MAVECFCGCGRKVKFTRRALNGTGGLVQGQLDAWRAQEQGLRETDAWTPGLEHFLGWGEHVAAELREMTHGGPLRVTSGQREITAWINRSNALLEQVTAGDASGIAELPEPDAPAPAAGSDRRPAPPPGDKAARRAEIEAIRAEYEAGEDESTCPECGAVIPDPGEYLAHVSSAHPTD